jgi:hypothetical protein
MVRENVRKVPRGDLAMLLQRERLSSDRTTNDVCTQPPTMKQGRERISLPSGSDD